ncbi:histone-lysine N-methyltransferase PRDM9-like [Silurus meridionalis]|nr:histone-lysine N-methyltransferase PRDM9-like [Silurus meridionalis]XP_046696245.1 histone-lysine N-methyltransferase PRDM9-like [Silurus meridionalis]XP_046696246.1 histone-lysine N-methyltransferase PRDM9-like [Silurus meridionalis]
METSLTSDEGTSGFLGRVIVVNEDNGGLETPFKEEPRDEYNLRGETSEQQNEEFQMKLIKKEDDEEAEDEDYLYCEICKSFFINKCELHGPPLFIPDTPVLIGVWDRARQTLPPFLEIRKSDIPDAGLGVFNTGGTVPVGVHFGPYEGELVDREEAMKSGYSWVISNRRQCEQYIDAKREIHANWMRYVNCARNDEEQNLVAFQYRGGIFYRCSRPIEPGQELLLWYGEEYAKDLSIAFHYLWKKKCFANGLNSTQVFSCSLCPASYTSQVYFHKHVRRCHYEEYLRLLNSGEIKFETLMPTRSSASQQTSSGSQSARASNGQKQQELHRCSDCGKDFPQPSVLQLHQCIPTGKKMHQCSSCGRVSVTKALSSDTSAFTPERNRSIAHSVGGVSLRKATCKRTSASTPERNRSSAHTAGKVLITRVISSSTSASTQENVRISARSAARLHSPRSPSAAPAHSHWRKTLSVLRVREKF